MGLIPAHAGKTASTRSPPQAWKAHPRSRGENLLLSEAASGGVGSSPLTRGKPAAMISHSDAARLIPAHAGKTLVCEALSEYGGAHPRSRGENRRAHIRARDD